MKEATDYKEPAASAAFTYQSAPPVPLPAKPRRTRKRFTLAVALLVAVLLIGCMLVIVANVHPYTGMATISQPDPTPTPTSAVTSTSVPNQFPAQKCPKTPGAPGQTWAAWYRLCLAGKFTNINQALHLIPEQGAGYNVTLLAAYADRNELILLFDLGPVSAPRIASFSNIVATKQGQQLSPLGANGFSLENQHTAWISPYDTSSLPASQQTLTVKVTPSVKAQSYNSHTKVSFAPFTVSLAKTVSLTPKQAVTANGLTLTLSKLTISPSGAQALLTPSHLPTDLNNYSATIQAGQTSIPCNSASLLTWQKAPVFAFRFENDLSTYHGPLILTVTISGMAHPWVFHLTT